MALVFIGIDLNTGDKQSPTVWVDQEKQELVYQGWKPSPELEPSPSANGSRRACRSASLATPAPASPTC